MQMTTYEAVEACTVDIVCPAGHVHTETFMPGEQVALMAPNDGLEADARFVRIEGDQPVLLPAAPAGRAPVPTSTLVLCACAVGLVGWAIVRALGKS